MPWPKQSDDEDSCSEYNGFSDAADTSSGDGLSEDDLAEMDLDDDSIAQDDLDDISDHGSVPESPPADQEGPPDVLTEDHISKLYHGNRKPPEFYREKMEGFNAKDFQRRNLATRTEDGINQVLYEWRMCVACYSCIEYWLTSTARFYRVVLQQPWRRSMKRIDLAMLQSFSKFHLYQERGRDGRKKRKTKISRSLQTFRNRFTQLYRRETLKDPYHRLEKNAVVNVSPQTPGNTSGLAHIPNSLTPPCSWWPTARRTSTCPMRRRTTGL